MWKWSAALVATISSMAHARPRRFSLPALPSLAAMSRAAAEDREPVAPRCFAYAPKRRLFVCLGHDAIYNTDHIGADDQATNLRIDVVGPGHVKSWTVAAIGGRPTTRRAIVETALGALGLRALRRAPVKLAPNAWTRVGDVSLRLTLRPHDGDASFENFGHLDLRCRSGVEIELDLRGAGLELGETAWVFRAPSADPLAVSIVGFDGGEDTSQYSLDTVVIDIAATCARPAAATWTTTAQLFE